MEADQQPRLQRGDHLVQALEAAVGLVLTVAAMPRRSMGEQDVDAAAVLLEPWFRIEVVLLLLAGRPFLRTPTRWATMPVIIGAALIDVFSTLLAVNKLHFAIY